MTMNTGRYTVKIKQELDRANNALCSSFRPDLETAIRALTLIISTSMELQNILKEERQKLHDSGRQG